MLFAAMLIAATMLPNVVAAAPPAPCSGPEYRQFDFWVGNWTVNDTKSGQLIGHSDVTLIQDQCALQEHWSGAQGSTGTSFNIYYAGDKQWHQTWVDNHGVLLRLDGGIVDGKMVLSGGRTDRTGKNVIDRITWTPEPNGDVRQVWDVSSDGGKSWQNSFDGTYTRTSDG